MKKSPRRGADQWQQVISEHATSGLSIAAYCRSWGISQPSFFVWRRRLAGAGVKASPSAASFVEVKAPASEVKAAGRIDVRLGGGRWLRVRKGFDRGLLVELVRVLENLA
jgi:transposase-like protein